MRLSILLIAVLFLGIVFCGCSRENKSDLELLKKDDPYFQNMLAMKQQAEHEIKRLKGQLSEQKSLLNRKVGELQASYRREQDGVESKIQTLRAKVLSNRDVYKREIASANELLLTKEQQLGELEATLVNLKSVLEKKGELNFTPAEMGNWQEKRAGVEKRIATLQEESARLRSDIAFKERKLKYL